jgi:transcriptional regulator with GAF, ATPase, and Fis domain
MKVFDKDKMYLKITALDGDLRGQQFEKRIQIQDINLHSISFTCPQYFQTNDKVRLTIYNKRFFNKWELDVDGIVARAFVGEGKKGLINYGVKLEKQEDESELKYFLKDFVHGFSSARLTKYLIESAISEKNITAGDGVELYSLLAAIYNEKHEIDSQVIIDYTTSHLQAEYARLYIINTETDKLEAVYASNAGEKNTLDFRESYPGRVFTSGNIANYLLSENSENKNILKSILAAPVFNKNNKIIGVLEVSNKNIGRFTHYDENTITFLAHIVSANYENYEPFTKNTAVTQFNPTLRENFLYLGQSKNANFVRSTFKKLQNTNENIFIVGEPGLGKSFIAKTLHYNGTHALKDLKILNCNEKDHIAQQIDNGFEEFKLEEEGTILLKDIDTLIPQEQYDLYHQLQHSKKRIISTSSLDLHSYIKDGQYNEELFKFLNKAYIHLKPLRNRYKDIISIANYFLEVECEKRNIPKAFYSDETKRKLFEYKWPGNIEELERLIKKSLMKSANNESEKLIIDLEIPIQDNSYEIDTTDISTIVNTLAEHADKTIPLEDSMKLIAQVLDRGKIAS